MVGKPNVLLLPPDLSMATASPKGRLAIKQELSGTTRPKVLVPGGGTFGMNSHVLEQALELSLFPLWVPTPHHFVLVLPSGPVFAVESEP